jgi:hypothetical protein
VMPSQCQHRRQQQAQAQQLAQDQCLTQRRRQLAATSSRASRAAPSSSSSSRAAPASSSMHSRPAASRSPQPAAARTPRRSPAQPAMLRPWAARVLVRLLPPQRQRLALPAAVACSRRSTGWSRRLAPRSCPRALCAWSAWTSTSAAL